MKRAQLLYLQSVRGQKTRLTKVRFHCLRNYHDKDLVYIYIYLHTILQTDIWIKIVFHIRVSMAT
jgi:hypothetical protein